MVQSRQFAERTYGDGVKQNNKNIFSLRIGLPFRSFFYCSNRTFVLLLLFFWGQIAIVALCRKLQMTC